MSQTTWSDWLNTLGISHEALSRAVKFLDDHNVPLEDTIHHSDFDAAVGKIKNNICEAIWNGLENITRQDVELLLYFITLKNQSNFLV